MERKSKPRGRYGRALVREREGSAAKPPRRKALKSTSAGKLLKVSDRKFQGSGGTRRRR
ncbi:MAG TPA: hypothetical protein VI643_04455 [Planctomycetota bacterium]|nr:hypothetical protein [Planctomycetota bacterium]